MNKIMTASLTPTQSTPAEYQWIESGEIEGADGWDDVESFLALCVDDVEIVENPGFAIHNFPAGAVVTTAPAGEEGHMKSFVIFWIEQGGLHHE